MKKEVLLELASRWEADAKAPECQNGAPEAEKQNRINQGIREGKRECADGLRTLVKLLSQ